MDIHRHIFLLSGFENTFFSFHLRCFKNENLWCFSPYPVTTTIIWPTSDRIPHSLIFKRMQIKRIADNVHALFFKLTNWNKEPDEKKLHRRESSSNKKKNFIQTQRISASAFIRGLYIGFINLLMISYCDVIKKCSLLD